MTSELVLLVDDEANIIQLSRLCQVLRGIVEKFSIQARRSNVNMNNTGSGIALEDQKRIFERFYQADKSRRGSEKRGVGLGLSIAKQIMLAHHGEIWVEGNPDKGSTFLVRVPVSLLSDATINRSRRSK